MTLPAGQTAAPFVAPASAPVAAAPAAEPLASPPGEGAPPPEVAPVLPEEDPRFAARFAALTKKERSIVERERALKAKEADPEFAAFKAAKSGGKTDPMALLEAHGWNYDQLTQFVLGDRKLTPEQQVRLLQEQVEADKKERTDKETQAAKVAEEKTIAEYHTAIARHVQTNVEKYELTSLHEDGAALVYDVIEEHWKATGGPEGGIIMPVDDACTAVESYLEREAREKVLKAKKFAPRTEAPPAGGPAPETRPTTTLPATLTNRSVTGATPVNAQTTDHLSDDDSKKAAAALLRWRQ